MVLEGDGRHSSASHGQNDLPVVDLWFSGIRELAQRMRQWVSADGIFVATPEPQPPSSVARVRLILADGFVLAEGTAVVVWTRPESGGAGCDSGMGMRWVVLPEASRRVIEQLVQEHEAEGGRPFDPDRLPEGGLAPEDGWASVVQDDQPTVVQSISAPAAVLLPRGSNVAAVEQPGDEVRVDEVDDRHGVSPEAATADPRSAGMPPRPAQVAPDGTEERGLSKADQVLGQPGVELRHTEAASSPDLAGELASAFAEPEIVVPYESDLRVGEPPVGRTAWPWWLMAVAVLAAVVAAVVVLSTRSTTGTTAGVLAPKVSPQPPRESSTIPTIPISPAVPVDGGRGELEEPTEPPERPQSGPAVVPRESTPEPVSAAGPSGESGEPVVRPPDRLSEAVAGIVWSRGQGETVVEIKLGSGLAPDSAVVSAMSDPPRVLVRIPRVTEPFSELMIPVGTPELLAIRSWLHGELRPPELHVVIDLAGDRVKLLEVRRGAHSVVLTLGQQEPAASGS
jgi:hypothetical protein